MPRVDILLREDTEYTAYGGVQDVGLRQLRHHTWGIAGYG